MNITKLKNKIVRITFLDAETIPTWTYPSCLDAKIGQVNNLYVVGILLNQNKDYTCICMGYNDEGGVLNLQRIPTGSIQEIKKI